MGYQIAYARVYNRLTEEQRQRKSVLDLVEYLGLRRSLILFRAMRACKTMADIDSVNVACSFAGVDGYPIRSFIERFHGREALDRWSKAKVGSTEAI